MIDLILILPFFCFSIISLWGFLLGRFVSIFFILFFFILAIFITVYYFLEIICVKTQIVVHFWDWILSPFDSIKFGLLFDEFNLLMVILVYLVSFFVFCFSYDYLSEDPYLLKFFSFLSLFVFSMIILISSNNLLQLFFGWEGVGLSSYLLINFWHTRFFANKAALKAMVLNRVADLFFFLGIIIIYLFVGSLDFFIIFDCMKFFFLDFLNFFNIYTNSLDIICFFLFIGAIGKSAQLFFHSWLADAMEGPTPVSSLLHAATMVTAGVFLLIRFSSFFINSLNISFLLLYIGGFTAFFFGFSSIFQYDLKKVVAFSTCSQLGFMFFICGLSYYNLAFFHLFNHGFFKALLFLSSGSIIHSVINEQDLRKFGNFFQSIPFIYFSFFLASCAIIGIPFLSGFYSKDLIIEYSFFRIRLDSFFIYNLITISALFTAIYSVKVIISTFFFSTNLFKSLSFLFHQGFLFNILPLFFFSLFSFFIGYFLSDLFSIWGSYYLNRNVIFDNPYFFFNFEIEFLSFFVKNYPIILVILGYFIVYIFFSEDYKYLFKTLDRIFYNKIFIISFFYSAFYFNKIYNFIISFSFFNIFYPLYNKLYDKGYLDYLIGPFGISSIIFYFSKFIKISEKWSLSIIYHLLFLIYALGLFIIIFFYINSFSSLLLDVIFYFQWLYLMSTTRKNAKIKKLNLE